MKELIKTYNNKLDTIEGITDILMDSGVLKSVVKLGNNTYLRDDDSIFGLIQIVDSKNTFVFCTTKYLLNEIYVHESNPIDIEVLANYIYVHRLKTSTK